MEADVTSISWLRFAFASCVVLGLLALMGWGLKVVSTRGWLTPRSGAKRDLACTASLALDGRRRVVVVKKDNIEYFLLLGPNNDLLLSQTPCPPAPDNQPQDVT